MDQILFLMVMDNAGGMEGHVPPEITVRMVGCRATAQLEPGPAAVVAAVAVQHCDPTTVNTDTSSVLIGHILLLVGRHLTRKGRLARTALLNSDTCA